MAGWVGGCPQHPGASQSAVFGQCCVHGLLLPPRGALTTMASTSRLYPLHRYQAAREQQRSEIQGAGWDGMNGEGGGEGNREANTLKKK